MNRLSEVINEENRYLNENTIKTFEEIKLEETDGKIILNLKEFNIQDVVIKKRLILYTINKTIGTAQNVEKVNIEDIIKLCANNVGNKYLTPNKNIKISVNKGKIFFEKF